MRLLPHELLLANLKGGLKNSRGYIPKERAYAQLKKISGQDFGYDVKAWRQYIRSSGGPKKTFPHLDSLQLFRDSDEE